MSIAGFFVAELLDGHFGAQVDRGILDILIRWESG
jgi:hypothetical protein